MVQSRNRKEEVICCKLWKTKKPTGPSRWHCVWCRWEVIHRQCRQAEALLWIKGSLTIALGLPHSKQIKHSSAFLSVEPLIPHWSYLLISKLRACFWHVGVLKAWRRNILIMAVTMSELSTHFLLCIPHLPWACLHGIPSSNHKALSICLCWDLTLVWKCNVS